MTLPSQAAFTLLANRPLISSPWQPVQISGPQSLGGWWLTGPPIITNPKAPKNVMNRGRQMSGPPAPHWLVGRPFRLQPSIHPPSSTCPELLSTPFFLYRHHPHIFNNTSTIRDGGSTASIMGFTSYETIQNL